jgi:hypothetical protein
MNFLSTSAFVLFSSWIYFKKYNKIGAMIGLISGILGMTQFTDFMVYKKISLFLNEHNMITV